MGGVINTLFGGGSSKQMDKALDFAKDVYKENKAMATPFISGGQGTFNAYNNMLTGPGQQEAFTNWLNSSDYQFTTKAGLDAITQNMASKGLLNSGSTLKAITQWGQDNAQQYRNNYMNQLLGSAQLGAGVAGNLMGANNQSASLVGELRGAKAEGKASGVGNFLNFGLGVAGLISDERAKYDIKRIGKLSKRKGGAPIYAYKYKGDPSGRTHIGPMAQDIAKTLPNAMGRPLTDGTLTIRPEVIANA